jgi:rod shape determining protein RodA
MALILEKRWVRDFDWLLLLLAVAISSFGTWMIFNAQPDAPFWKKQVIGLVISLVVMLAVAFTDYRKLVHIAPAFYVFGLLLLVVVLVPGIGLKINGQRCWIGVPGLGQFQPSEFMKIPTVLMLARYFGKNRQSPLTIKEMIVGGLILAVPVGLIMLEPDTGQSLTYFPLLAVVLFLSSVRMWLVLAALILGTASVPLMWYAGTHSGLIKQYQQERINVILDPENADRRGFGYHTWQSIVTVGEGGVTGAHTGSEDSQSALKFLPEPHSDFIFAVTSEHTGFVGACLLLLAYWLLLTRLVRAARRAPDRPGMLFIMAMVGGLGFQIFINVGMALGLLPVIGVPLPLMSAGLASLASTFIAIGFAVSVQNHRFVN